jgi:hypothetical protein
MLSPRRTQPAEYASVKSGSFGDHIARPLLLARIGRMALLCVGGVGCTGLQQGWPGVAPR